MHLDSLEYLVNVLEKHCSPRGVEGKKTEQMSLDQNKMLEGSRLLFMLFPRGDAKSGSDRRRLIEERIEDRLGTPVTIVDARAMSQERSPFSTIESLAVYLEQLILEAEGA